MTSVQFHSVAQTGVARASDAAARAQRAVMAVISVKWFKGVYRNYHSRKQLAGLSPHLLADIGLTEAQRQAELSKPFWNYQRPGK